MMPAPTKPTSRIAQARAAFLADDSKTALKIVSDFHNGLTRDELHLFKDGYEAHLYPSFFWQVGRDPKKVIADACALFSRKYVEV